ncbi:MAG TPA: hypothetical protein VJV78_41760 [Polyangiales bacterium]|nr:hypothetical protein [Polyangiales bacterium]
MPELSRLRRLGAAVFAVYYNTQWRERGLLNPAMFPGDLAMLGLDEAVELIARDFVTDPKYGRAFARLALAQLARASAAPGGAELDHERLMRPLIRALMADGDSASAFLKQRPPQGDPEDACRKHLLHESLVHPNERFINALSAFDGLGRSMRHFCKSWSYADRITDICVSVDVKRPYAEFPELIDPRNWSKNVPLVWEASEPLDGLPQSIQGPFTRDAKPGPFEGKFYEVAMFSIGLINFATYRNLLNININEYCQDCAVAMPQKPGPVSTFFCYTQYECLETDMLGLGRFYGGIDVDRGFGMAEKIDEEWTRLWARKRARFDQPPGLLNELYNDIASVYLPMLIESLVVFAAII